MAARQRAELWRRGRAAPADEPAPLSAAASAEYIPARPPPMMSTSLHGPVLYVKDVVSIFITPSRIVYYILQKKTNPIPCGMGLLFGG